MALTLVPVGQASRLSHRYQIGNTIIPLVEQARRLFDQRDDEELRAFGLDACATRTGLASSPNAAHGIDRLIVPRVFLGCGDQPSLDRVRADVVPLLDEFFLIAALMRS